MNTSTFVLDTNEAITEVRLLKYRRDRKGQPCRSELGLTNFL